MTTSQKKPSFLRVDGTNIVDGEGNIVILKGCATGGHTNMENFITKVTSSSGFPGHESELRARLLDVLGKEKCDYFFDKFLEYFFMEEDAKFLKSLGLNCVRIPVNHRHFIDDLAPDTIKEEGFQLVDRIVDICAAEGIYTIIDLHTTPGGQNGGWHADSGCNRAHFWEHKDHQDRVIQIWQAIAKHYKENTWVAGYNKLNEPADPDHINLQAFYDRIFPAIREIDSDHILFPDGNTYSMDFTAFKKVFPNTVYSIHDYSNMGFPSGVPYTGTPEQNDILQKQYNRKVEFMKQHKTPIWNGEFGPVYASPDEADYEKINQQRYNLLGQQLKIYKQDHISWSIWLYKDIGFQGMTFLSPDSAYIKLLAPFLAKKKRLGIDKWGRDDQHVKDIYAPLIAHFKEEIPEDIQKKRYPQHWGLEGHLHRVVREMLMSEYLSYEFAEYFRGKSFEELDELAASFKLSNCVKREGLNDILRKDAETA